MGTTIAVAGLAYLAKRSWPHVRERLANWLHHDPDEPGHPHLSVVSRSPADGGPPEEPCQIQNDPESGDEPEDSHSQSMLRNVSPRREVHFASPAAQEIPREDSTLVSPTDVTRTVQDHGDTGFGDSNTSLVASTPVSDRSHSLPPSGARDKTRLKVRRGRGVHRDDPDHVTRRSQHPPTPGPRITWPRASGDDFSVPPPSYQSLHRGQPEAVPINTGLWDAAGAFNARQVLVLKEEAEEEDKTVL